MFNITSQEADLVIEVLSRSAKSKLHDAEEALGIFLIANQQGNRFGITLSRFQQLLIHGVLTAAKNLGIEGATTAESAFERAKGEAKKKS